MKNSTRFWASFLSEMSRANTALQDITAAISKLIRILVMVTPQDAAYGKHCRWEGDPAHCTISRPKDGKFTHLTMGGFRSGQTLGGSLKCAHARNYLPILAVVSSLYIRAVVPAWARTEKGGCRAIQDWERTHRSPAVRRLLWESIPATDRGETSKPGGRATWRSAATSPAAGYHADRLA